MGTIILNDDEIDVTDGENIVECIEEAGVPIGCSNGVCGTCEVEVTEDQNTSKELEPLALGLVKKFDRLQVLSKKEINEG